MPHRGTCSPVSRPASTETPARTTVSAHASPSQTGCRRRVDRQHRWRRGLQRLTRSRAARVAATFAMASYLSRAPHATIVWPSTRPGPRQTGPTPKRSRRWSTTMTTSSGAGRARPRKRAGGLPSPPAKVMTGLKGFTEPGGLQRRDPRDRSRGPPGPEDARDVRRPSFKANAVFPS
jgi:hypothetical protein